MLPAKPKECRQPLSAILQVSPDSCQVCRRADCDRHKDAHCPAASDHYKGETPLVNPWPLNDGTLVLAGCLFHHAKEDREAMRECPLFGLELNPQCDKIDCGGPHPSLKPSIVTPNPPNKYHEELLKGSVRSWMKDHNVQTKQWTSQVRLPTVREYEKQVLIPLRRQKSTSDMYIRRTSPSTHSRAPLRSLGQPWLGSDLPSSSRSSERIEPRFPPWY